MPGLDTVRVESLSPSPPAGRTEAEDRGWETGADGPESAGRAATDPLGDLDGDGALDLAVANIGQGNALYLNDGNAGFDFAIPFGRDDGRSDCLAVHDLDGDGFADVVTANSDGKNAVYRNVAR